MSENNDVDQHREERELERVTLRMTQTQLERIDALVEDGEYVNRSAAIREGARIVNSIHNRPDDGLRNPYPTDE